MIYPLASMLGGKLADSYGRKRLIMLFDTLAALLYLACGFIQPSITLIYVILSASACMSIAGPAHDSLIADLTVPENRAGAYALSYMGWNIGFAIGPMLGGRFLNSSSVESAWLLVGGISMVSATFMFVLEKYEKKTKTVAEEALEA